MAEIRISLCKACPAYFPVEVIAQALHGKWIAGPHLQLQPGQDRIVPCASATNSLQCYTVSASRFIPD